MSNYDDTGATCPNCDDETGSFVPGQLCDGCLDMQEISKTFSIEYTLNELSMLGDSDFVSDDDWRKGFDAAFPSISSAFLGFHIVHFTKYLRKAFEEYAKRLRLTEEILKHYDCGPFASHEIQRLWVSFPEIVERLAKSEIYQKVENLNQIREALDYAPFIETTWDAKGDEEPQLWYILEPKNPEL